MKLFLDDERPAPPGWRLVRWPDDVIDLLRGGEVTHLSLDHDLGDDDEGTGYDVILWIEEAVATSPFVPPVITVHSANGPARKRMEAGIASIERIVREFHAQSSVDLVRLALAHHHEFKRVLPVLTERPPDEAAAALVVADHARDDAPPWLAALLLGRLRVPATYSVVRDILAAAPGAMAEERAGRAMARIAGPGAREDLLELLTQGAHLRTREGAAAGLGVLGTPNLAPFVLAARRAGRIRRDCAASTLAELHLPTADLVALLQSAAPDDRALAIRVVADQLSATRPDPIDPALARAAHEALAADRLGMESSRRQTLLERLAPGLPGPRRE